MATNQEQNEAKTDGKPATAAAPAPAATGEDQSGSRRVTINWDDSKMATNFSNVVNVQSSQEQVDLFFGTNQTWNTGKDGSVTVELNNRLILTPHAAKRMWAVLGGVLREYEQRYGKLGNE